MKANELRIGNYYNEFGIPKQVTPEIIAKIHKAQLSGKTILDATPIPITEEWLLRLGFRLFPSGYYCKDITSRSFYFSTGRVHDKEIRLILEGDDKALSVELKINTVHQLQNLYFALTGEELTLNEPNYA